MSSLSSVSLQSGPQCAGAQWLGVDITGSDRSHSIKEPGRSAVGCSPFFYYWRLGVHRAVTGRTVMLGRMADFLVMVGIVVFVTAMLGLIWGLERV